MSTTNDYFLSIPNTAMRPLAWSEPSDDTAEAVRARITFHVGVSDRLFIAPHGFGCFIVHEHADGGFSMYVDHGKEGAEHIGAAPDFMAAHNVCAEYDD